ncbi:MAG: magnesium transporter [Planctomycetota bacterium]|nr:MAG: magnesium transporter [Planctomycetota bacterium]
MAIADLEQRASELGDRLWHILQEDGPGALAIAATSLRVADLTRILERMGLRERTLQTFLALPVGLAAEVLEEAHPETRDQLLNEISDRHLAEILQEADADDAVYFLDHLDEERAEHLLNSLDDNLRAQLEEQWDLDEDSAGRIMQREVATVRPFHSAEQAVARLRSHPDLPDSPVYVVDAQSRLIGVIGYRDLVFAQPQSRMSSLMDRDPMQITLDTDREKVASLMQRYHLAAIPVVDSGKVLRGMITWDDAIDVIEAEAHEDMLAMAGTREDIEDNDGIFRRARYRLPFLLVTVCGGFVVAGVIDSRADTLLSDFPILMAFLPLVPALGGNIGLQCSTVTIRSIALGHHTPGRRMIRSMREVATGSVLAVALAVLCGLGALGLILFSDQPFMLAGVIATSLLVAVILAATLGVAIPNACIRLGIDPAIAAGPFITMLNDITGVTIYLMVASLLLASLG